MSCSGGPAAASNSHRNESTGGLAGTAALDPDAEVIARRVGEVLFHSRADLMAGIALECFQQFLVVRYNDSLLLTPGLLPLATGRLADRFSRTFGRWSLHSISGMVHWNHWSRALAASRCTGRSPGVMRPQ